jgi:dTDP-4-dehydrorhamnose 3,5-epimerase
MGPERAEDERGFFARTYCVRELAEHGIDATVVQRSLSYNRKRGTLRGMHYQGAPHGENKIVSVRRGAIFDVAIDLRRDSPTYKIWFGTTLTDEDARSLFIPKGCAHGFITLVDGTMVDYSISSFYEPSSAQGVRWDDPAFRVEWPLQPIVIADRDRRYADFVDG